MDLRKVLSFSQAVYGYWRLDFKSISKRFIQIFTLVCVCLEPSLDAMSDNESESEVQEVAPKIRITGFEEAAKQAGYFGWNDETNYTLAKYVKKHSAHFVTDIGMEIKYKCVKADVLTHDQFKLLNPDITWKTLKQQFERSKKQILDRCGYSKEGANLSGKGMKTEYEDFIIALEKQLWTKKRARDDKNMKDHQQDVLLNDIAAVGLKKQGKLAKLPVSASKTDSSDLTNEEDKENSSSASNATNPKSFFNDLKDDIAKIMALGTGGGEVDDEKALRMQLLREQLEETRLNKAIKKKQLEKMMGMEDF